MTVRCICTICGRERDYILKGQRHTPHIRREVCKDCMIVHIMANTPPKERRKSDRPYRSKNGHLPMVQGKSVPRRRRMPLRGMEGV